MQQPTCHAARPLGENPSDPLPAALLWSAMAQHSQAKGNSILYSTFIQGNLYQ